MMENNTSPERSQKQSHAPLPPSGGEKKRKQIKAAAGQTNSCTALRRGKVKEEYGKATEKKQRQGKTTKKKEGQGAKRKEMKEKGKGREKMMGNGGN